MPRLLRHILVAVVGLAILAAIVWAFLPTPVPVDLAEVTRGEMLVTVDEDGQTRIKERYVVSAPLAGRLRRIDLDPGDAVEAQSSVVAVIDPTDPHLLDARQLAEAEARVRGAEAGLLRAGATLEQLNARAQFTEDELERIQNAYGKGAATRQELETRMLLHRQASEGHRAAQFAEEIARFELEQARSALLRTKPPESGDKAGSPFEIQAPISGRVLRVFQESVAVLAPGTPLLEIGDPRDLELVIDVLSVDAVQVLPGAPIIVEHWGGQHSLEAAVRLVEPSAFTKISALGVEEQRVNVIADFVSPYEERATLGDGYRIEAAIVLWQAPDVIQVPASALFRISDRWAVFVVEDGYARTRLIEIGRRNGLRAEVREGLQPGELVVTHPSDAVADGIRVAARPQPTG
jgi:HlyD family secretion protein